MNYLENFLLESGLSWSASKAFPYLFCVLFGLILVFIFRKIKIKTKWIFRIILILFFLLPFVIYFSIYPIYEGDFSNQGIKPHSSIQFPSSKSLTVIALPDCPYCYQSIALMKKIKKRNPTIPISYWIVSADTLPPKSAILKVIPSEFSTSQHHNVSEISKLVQGTFPCFIISENKKAVKLWNNNQFGVCALDEIEEFFK